MVAILYPRRLRNLLDVTQPQGTGLPDQGVPLLFSSNSSFVIETVAGGGGGSFSLGASNLGNTLGQTGVTGTRVVLAGIGNITLSQLTDGNGGTISISGAGGGAGFSAGVSGGNTAGDTGVTGTRLVLAGGQSITLSQATDVNGGTVTIVGASTSQSVQTQNRFNLTLSGNTAGALAQVSSGTLTLAGGNGITLSQAGNAITISGVTQSVQPETQTFIGGISASDTLYTSGSVRFTGSNIVTVRSGTGQLVVIDASQSVQPETQTFLGGIAASDTTYTSGTVRITGVGGGVTVSSNTGQRIDISVAAQSVQTQNLIAMTLSGNTSGAQALISSGTMTLAGGNNITVSQNGNAVTISGPNVGGAQTGISGLANSETTYTSGSVTFSALGAITIRSTTGQHFQFSVNSQSVQPETQTFLGGIAASDKTYTSGTVVLTGAGGGITVQSNAGQTITLSVAAPVAQTGTQFSGGLSNIGNTAGDTGTVAGRLVLAGGNNITLSGSTNGASETITISAGAGGGYSAGISNLGNTAGDTGVTGTRMVLAGGNNVTVSQATDANGNTVTVSAFNQSVQSLGMYAVQNTTGQSSSTTMDARTLSVAGDGAVSVGYSAGSLRISAPTQTVQTQGILSAGVSTGGNTLGNTQVSTGSRLVIVGSGMITASQGTAAGASTITLNATQSVQTQGVVSLGVSTGGNTSGDTGVATGSRLVFVGGNNITLSQGTAAGASTITISAPNLGAGAMSAGASNLGNTAGSTGITGTQLVLVGSGVMSLSQSTGANGGTVSFLAPATSSLVGASGLSVSTNGSTISVYATNASEYVPYRESPIVTGQQGQATLHIQPLDIPNVQHDRVLLGMQISNATNSSNSITISAWVGLYTRNASSISLVSSTSGQTNFSGSGSVGSYSLYGGPKWMSIPWTNTITSHDYYVGIVVRTTTGGGAGHTISQLLLSRFTNSAFSGIIGEGSNATNQMQLGLGVYTVSTAGMPNVIAFNEINGTGSLVLRVPLVQFRSGTV